ncbi:unnamed protein product [Protopolystoma xenopodis]|uniref:Uncharacterized protein n=1 Tax=Protopolystoma xenopodis TaxID=117903 RepID=A0A448XCF5_9PLAT|nr:unnamed protein product [Protopolystoma xenopodis]
MKSNGPFHAALSTLIPPHTRTHAPASPSPFAGFDSLSACRATPPSPVVSEPAIGSAASHYPQHQSAAGSDALNRFIESPTMRFTSGPSHLLRHRLAPKICPQ